MARTGAGETLTRQHRRAQLRVSADTARGFARLWPVWDGTDRSFGRLVDVTVPWVQLQHRQSVGLASGYYRAFRQVEGVDGAFSPRAAAFNPDRVVSSLYVTGQAQTAASRRAGLSAAEVRRQALVRTTGAVTRHALAGGRETIVGSVQSDPAAGGWQRVTSGRPCAFCTMLSSRGPVYRAQASADFQAHDHCSCSAQPVYSGGEWTSQNVAHRELYDRVAAGSSDPLNALRRELAA